MGPSQDAIKQSFELAAEVVKQLISLSTGIIALMITFSKDLIGSVTPGGLRLLRTSWTLYLVSMVLGVFALNAMTTSLARDDTPSVYATNIRWLSSLQWLLFLAATGVLVTYAGRMLGAKASQVTAKEVGVASPETEKDGQTGDMVAGSSDTETK